jgi:phenylpropionate dioxygenase-like ring-hydroxylating dioxygenase large terminal subunit
MDPVVEQRLIERVLVHLGAGSSDAAEGEARIAVGEYLDPGRLAAERRALLGRLPVLVAPASQLVQPGDFVTVDHHGPPLLATRDKDGRAHVFLNVCRHRGTRLVSEAAGTARPSFVCPYHAWAYASDGRLLGINRPQAFPETARERPGLVELPSAERVGMVWAALDRDAAGNAGEFGAAFDASLGPLGPELEALGRAYPFAYQPHARTWRANWKVLIEAGLETYHFRIAHHDTISPMFHDDFLLRDRFGPHQRMVLPRRSFAALADGPRPPGSLRKHANLVYFIFPSVTILAQADHLVLIEAHPVSVAESHVVVTMLLAGPPEDERARAFWDKNRTITLQVLDQDFSVCERVQEGLASGALAETRLGRNEVGIAEFHRDIAERIGSGTSGTSGTPGGESPPG